MQLNVRTFSLAAIVCLALTSIAAAAQDFRDVNFDYFVSGDPDAPRAAHTEFGLALFGGGGRVDSAFSFLAARGGHGHMLILRAVSDDSFDPTDGDYGHQFMERWGPVASAETLVFHNRRAAFDPRVAQILARADGIFIAGGDQSNYIRYWKGTPVQAALNAHVRARRPIGGSSAGLAILGRYSYTAMDGGSLESKQALLRPLDPAVTLEEDFLHFRGLEHVVTDTHFGRRARLGRLIVFLAQIESRHPGESILGIGVDEKSALLVDADGTAHLAIDSAGSAWIVTLAQHPTLHAGEPLSAAGIHITRMDLRSILHLANGRVGAPADKTIDVIDAGLPANHSFASPLMLRENVPDGEG